MRLSPLWTNRRGFQRPTRADFRVERCQAIPNHDINHFGKPYVRSRTNYYGTTIRSSLTVQARTPRPTLTGFSGIDFLSLPREGFVCVSLSRSDNLVC